MRTGKRVSSSPKGSLSILIIRKGARRMSNLYEQFKTDEQLEKTGVEVDYGEFKVTLARAGGANKKFAKLLEAKTKPFKRAIQTETMDAQKALDILREVYSEAVILKWETKVDGKWKTGIETEDGEIIPSTPKNINETLAKLPDLFAEIQDQAGKSAIYRQTIREEDAKN